MKKWIVLLVLAALLGIGAGVWYYILTKDKRAVRELVANAVALFQKKETKLPHEGVLKHTRIEEYFSSQVSLKLTDPDITANWSNEEFKTKFALYNRMVKVMTIDIGEIEVEIADGKAIFSFDAQVSGSALISKDEFGNVYRVSGVAEKTDGKWKISSMIASPILK